MDRIEELVNKNNKDGFKVNENKLKSEWYTLNTARQKLTYELYNSGYLKSLDTYKDIDIVNILRKEYPEESESLDSLYSGVTGELDINKSRLLLASFRCNNEELNKIYKRMIDVYESEMLCGGFSKLSIISPEDLKTYNASIKVSDNGFSSPFKEYTSGLILPYLDFGDKVFCKSTKSVVYFDFLEYLGIKDETVLKCKEENVGVLLKDLTYTQEVLISDILIDATVHINKNSLDKDTYYAYVKHKKEFHKNTSNRFFVLPKTRKNLKKDLNDLVVFMEDLGISVKAVSNEYIVYSITGVLSSDAEEFLKEDTEIDSNLTRSWENSSIFCKNFNTGKLLSEVQYILGTQGEYIASANVDVLKNAYRIDDTKLKKAKTVEIVTLKKSSGSIDMTKVPMYSIESIDIPSKYNNSKLPINKITLEELQKKFGVGSVMELDKILALELNTLYDKYLASDDYMRFEEIRDVIFGVLRQYINELSDTRVYSKYNFITNEQDTLRKFYSSEDMLCFVALYMSNIRSKYRI